MKIPLQPSRGQASMLKSKFEAMLLPCPSENDVADCLAALKKESPKADHYPYAYFNKGKGHSSDDGEPGGTGGRPLLQLLITQGVDDAFLGVARYFGGTKLGTGNLRRCFVEAGQEALQTGIYGEVKKVYSYDVKLPYADYQALLRQSARFGFRVEEPAFESEVSCLLKCEHPLEETWAKMGYPLEMLGNKKEKEEIIPLEKL